MKVKPISVTMWDVLDGSRWWTVRRNTDHVWFIYANHLRSSLNPEGPTGRKVIAAISEEMGWGEK